MPNNKKFFLWMVVAVLAATLAAGCSHQTLAHKVAGAKGATQSYTECLKSPRAREDVCERLALVDTSLAKETVREVSRSQSRAEWGKPILYEGDEYGLYHRHGQSENRCRLGDSHIHTGRRVSVGGGHHRHRGFPRGHRD